MSTQTWPNGSLISSYRAIEFTTTPSQDGPVSNYNRLSVMSPGSKQRSDLESSGPVFETMFSTPRAFSEFSQERDLDALFEGEPDPDLFLRSGARNSHVVDTWLVSGGLGNGDTPYSQTKDETVDQSLFVPDRRFLNVPDPGSRPVTNDTACEPPKIWNNTPNHVQSLTQKNLHLATLGGDIFGRFRNSAAVYSATGSSESVSICEEDGPAEVQNEKPRMSACFVTRPIHTRPEQFKGDETAESKGEETPRMKCDGLVGNVLTSEGIHSAIWHSKPYLSEVTPAETQGQHPSIIPRSSNSSVSHTSSLAEELHNEDEEASQQAAEHVHKTTGSLSVNTRALRDADHLDSDSPLHSAALSPLYDGGVQGISGYSLLDSGSEEVFKQPGRPSPSVVQFDLKPPEIRPRGYFVPDCSNGGHAAHCDNYSCTHSSILPGTHFQYNSADLTPPLQGSGDSCWPNTQMTTTRIPTEKLMGSLGQHSTLERLNNDASHTSRTDSQAETTATNIAAQGASFPPALHDVLHLPPQIAHFYEDTGADPNLQGLDDPFVSGFQNQKASSTLHEDMSSPYSTPPAIPVQEAGVATPPSPLAGFQEAIHLAKRGSRRAPTPRKAITISTSTRGRAVSASPSKRKATDRSKTVSAACCQGEDVKVTKSRTRFARAASRKFTAVVKSSHGKDDSIPDVPKIPDDMDIDIQESKLQVEAQSQLRKHRGQQELVTIRQESDILHVPVNTDPNKIDATTVAHVVPSTAVSVTPQPSTSNLRKKTKVRAATPYRVQKLILRAPRMPPLDPAIVAGTANVTLPNSSRSNDQPDANHSDAGKPSQPPDPITPTQPHQTKSKSASKRTSEPSSKPRPRNTPRKAAPMSMKASRSTESTTNQFSIKNDDVPPIPPIPSIPLIPQTRKDSTTTNKTTTPLTPTSHIEQELRLTLQSADRTLADSHTISQWPGAGLRRSPRSSGVRPRMGL